MKALCLSLCGAVCGLAQAPDLKSLTGSARAMHQMVASNITKAAEKMPEENYSFKPTPEVRSYGAIVAHIADAQYLFCSAVIGEKNPAPGIEKSKTSKAEIQAALKEAFAYCDKAYALSDAQAAETTRLFGNERNKLNVLSFNDAHNMEHHGNLVTYLRMKGIVPPTSEGRR